MGMGSWRIPNGIFVSRCSWGVYTSIARSIATLVLRKPVSCHIRDYCTSIRAWPSWLAHLYFERALPNEINIVFQKNTKLYETLLLYYLHGYGASTRSAHTFMAHYGFAPAPRGAPRPRREYRAGIPTTHAFPRLPTWIGWKRGRR